MHLHENIDSLFEATLILTVNLAQYQSKNAYIFFEINQRILIFIYFLYPNSIQVANKLITLILPNIPYIFDPISNTCNSTNLRQLFLLKTT